MDASDEEKHDTTPPVRTVRAFCRAYSWQWFLVPMATLGLSTLINAQTKMKNFHGLYTIGLIFYFIGLVQYVYLIIMQLTRFRLIKGSLEESFDTPQEAMFFATFFISMYGTIDGAVEYSSPVPGSRLSVVLIVFFWIYLVCAMVASIGLHMLVFHIRHLENSKMMPAWLLPIFPVILIGVLASSFAKAAHPRELFSIEIAGLICSSMGFLLSISIAAIYLDRLFVAGLPEVIHRPAMMVAVGPPSYAALAFLKLATGIPTTYWFFAKNPGSAGVVAIVGLIFAVGVWGMACFFELVCLAAVLPHARDTKFSLSWYSLIFPNVGFLCTFNLIGRVIESEGIKYAASVATCVLCGFWIFTTLCHARALWMGRM